MLRPLDNPKCLPHASAGMACGQAGAGGGGSRSGGGGQSVELRPGASVGAQFPAQFTWITSTKVQILTAEEVLFLLGHPLPPHTPTHTAYTADWRLACDCSRSPRVGRT